MALCSIHRVLIRHAPLEERHKVLPDCGLPATVSVTPEDVIVASTAALSAVLVTVIPHGPLRRAFAGPLAVIGTGVVAGGVQQQITSGKGCVFRAASVPGESFPHGSNDRGQS